MHYVSKSLFKNPIAVAQHNSRAGGMRWWWRWWRCRASAQRQHTSSSNTHTNTHTRNANTQASRPARF